MLQSIVYSGIMDAVPSLYLSSEQCRCAHLHNSQLDDMESKCNWRYVVTNSQRTFPFQVTVLLFVNSQISPLHADQNSVNFHQHTQAAFLLKVESVHFLGFISKWSKQRYREITYDAIPIPYLYQTFNFLKVLAHRLGDDIFSSMEFSLIKSSLSHLMTVWVILQSASIG